MWIIVIKLYFRNVSHHVKLSGFIESRVMASNFCVTSISRLTKGSLHHLVPPYLFGCLSFCSSLSLTVTLQWPSLGLLKQLVHVFLGKLAFENYGRVMWREFSGIFTCICSWCFISILNILLPVERHITSWGPLDVFIASSLFCFSKKRKSQCMLFFSIACISRQTDKEQFFVACLYICLSVSYTAMCCYA